MEARTTPFLALIGGGTASGKTTIAREVAQRTGALHLCHDRYYKDVPEPVGFNYDHPDALDTGRLVEDLQLLVAGQAAELPVYEFKTHRRQPHTERVEPRPLILVEGILVLQDPRLRDLAHCCVFVEAADDLRLARRILRDVVSRGRDPFGVIRQYLDTVRPMHQQFVGPCRAFADLVVSGETSVDESVEAVLAGLAAEGFGG